MSKAKDVIGYAKDKKVAMVDLKFMDFLGLWQHFSIPLAELTEAVFDEGLGFDGSSIRGWMPIHNSDMLVVPDAETGVLDPFMKDTTLSLLCNIVDPITKEPYTRDPRFVAEGGEVPEGLRDRRRGVLRAGGGVLHLRRRLLRHRREPRPLQDRVARRAVGDRQRR